MTMTQQQPEDVTTNDVTTEAEATEADAPKQKFSPALAWTPALAKGRKGERGHVAVVRSFLRHYSSLKPFPLTSGEALFVIHIMDFKWGKAAPWPSYKTLAALMGVSEKMVRRHAQSLEVKGYLKRHICKSKWKTNLFDLTPLFAAVEKHVFGKVMIEVSPKSLGDMA